MADNALQSLFPRRRNTMQMAIDAMQSASNSAASNVSAPVDGIAWALRKAGVPMPEKPFMGSDWMADKGLTRPVEQSAASLAGETASLLTPLGVASKAPQIARGLLRMGENAMVPQALNKEAGMILYHGSNDNLPIKKINSGGVFGGLFASSSERSAASHGDAMYRMTIPDEKIMGVGDAVPFDQAKNIISQNIRKDSPHTDEITDMALHAKSAFDSSIPEGELLHALRSSSLGEADWELQRLRGELGKARGYKAVEMPDEHGTSYLVLPGTTARPANSDAKRLFGK